MNAEESALVAQVHREDRDTWEKEVERELDPCARGKRVEIVGGRKYKHGTVGTTFWWGHDRFTPGRFKVGLHPDGDPEAKLWIDSRWLRVIDGCEPPLSEYTSTDEEALEIAREQVSNAPPVHTVRGVPIGPEGVPYGTTHDMSCPGCADTPYLQSPRSETYWSA